MRTGIMSKAIRLGCVLASVVWMPAVLYSVEQLRFKPGFNLFSPQQDVQVGRENAAQIEKQLPILRDAEVERYVNDLGRRLAAYAPNNRSDYVWQFKIVNSRDINAFALPGGFIYVNRATIEAAQEEAQLAGVIAHEEGHVVMRHGTHQASEMLFPKLGLEVIGGMLGNSQSLLTKLAEVAGGTGLQLVLLRYSRSIEAQADQVGTYTLYQGGYDPHAMAQFFQIIEQKYPSRAPNWLSDHPNPGNRIQAVDAEIPELGPPKPWKTDSPEFETVKERLLRMPAPPQGRSTQSQALPPSTSPTAIPAPSAHLVNYRSDAFTIAYPDNWQVQMNDNTITLAPPGAIFADPQAESAQAYGASITPYQLSSQDGLDPSLPEATRHLVDSLCQSNPSMRVLRQADLSLRGHAALSTLLENDSPLRGQKELDNLVTVRAGSTLYALVFIAPQSALDAYQPAFQAMLQSFELR